MIGRGFEGRPAGEHLVEDRSQRIDVGRRADLAGQSLRLLGGHVAGRPHDLAADGVAILDLQPLGQAEVGDLRRAVGVEQDVGRLQVAVDDPDAVDRTDGAGERGRQLGGLAGRHRRAGQPLGERASLEHLEREVRHAADLAHLVDLDDVGMAYLGDDLGLDAESAELLGFDLEIVPDHLEGDRSLERPLEGLVDDPHPATAEQLKDFVAGDRGGAAVLRPGRRRVTIERVDGLGSDRHRRRAALVGSAGRRRVVRRVRARHSGRFFSAEGARDVALGRPEDRLRDVRSSQVRVRAHSLGSERPCQRAALGGSSGHCRVSGGCDPDTSAGSSPPRVPDPQAKAASNRHVGQSLRGASSGRGVPHLGHVFA